MKTGKGMVRVVSVAVLVTLCGFTLTACGAASEGNMGEESESVDVAESALKPRPPVTNICSANWTICRNSKREIVFSDPGCTVSCPATSMASCVVGACHVQKNGTVIGTHSNCACIGSTF